MALNREPWRKARQLSREDEKREQVDIPPWKTQVLKTAIIKMIQQKWKDLGNKNMSNLILFRINLIFKTKCHKHTGLVFIFIISSP